MVLTWTAPDRSHWTPEPDVAYTVTRDDGTTVTVVGEGIPGLTTSDTGVVSGRTYTYQVSAVAAGGASTHSARQTVTVVGNRPPTALGTLPNRTLPVGDGARGRRRGIGRVQRCSTTTCWCTGAVSSAPAVVAVSGSAEHGDG